MESPNKAAKPPKGLPVSSATEDKIIQGGVKVVDAAGRAIQPRERAEIVTELVRSGELSASSKVIHS